MTDQLDELHANAAFALLDANPVITGRVYVEEVPRPWPEPPYVVVRAAVSRPQDGAANALGPDSAGKLSVTFRVSWNINCIGETAASARAYGMQVRESLLDIRPTIAGRNCNPIVQDDGTAPAQIDESTGTPVWNLPFVYSLITVPG